MLHGDEEYIGFPSNHAMIIVNYGTLRNNLARANRSIRGVSGVLFQWRPMNHHDWLTGQI